MEFLAGEQSYDGTTNIEFDSDSDTPQRKTRSLQHIYETCCFALMISEPQRYEDAIIYEKWE